MTKKIILGFVFATTMSCENLRTLEKRELTELNPTEYTFNVPIDQARQTIFNSFNDFRTRKKTFYRPNIFQTKFKEHTIMVSFTPEGYPGLFGKDHFKNEGTEGDIYLHSFGIPWLSPIYYAGGQQLECRTAYIITLEKQTDDRTLIKVKPENTKVLKGIGGIGPHGFYSKEVSVDPTTVEEYSLILFIAEQLGDTTLRPLNLKTKGQD